MDKARAGTLLCLDQGEYSDYGVIGFFVVLQEFEPMAEVHNYLIEHPKEAESYSFSTDSFLAWLLKKGLILEIKYGTFFLSGYSSPDEISFTPIKE